MTPSEYSKLALRTVNDLGREKNITHAVLGIADEAGEIVGQYKKYFAYGKTLDNTNLVEEIGDACWFLNLLLHELGYTWEQAFEANILKLERRYPDLRFNAEHALSRQTQMELDAINQVI